MRVFFFFFLNVRVFRFWILDFGFWILDLRVFAFSRFRFSNARSKAISNSFKKDFPTIFSDRQYYPSQTPSPHYRKQPGKG